MAQVTITIPDRLLPVYQRFQSVNGQNWAGAFVTEKLKEVAQRLWTEDAELEYAKTTPRPRDGNP